MKMTAQQEKALRGLAEKDNDAYGLQVSLSTLRALKYRGLMSGESHLGSWYSPRTGITWSLTEQGRAWVNEHKAQEAAQ